MEDEHKSPQSAIPGTLGKPISAKAVTTPWATIEEHMKNRDEGSIKKTGDDLDTLLVFAGLYSGVLTGFIIEFYRLLQQDNDQLTVDLLSRISGQLANSTAEPGPDPSKATFHNAATSTTVNLLWFSSLFMSLSAALFAMVAKKWLREYLSWTSLSADPSEVVVLRQLRAQAWEQWHAPAIIGAIPALLELAVILFLYGLVVLVWTLDSVVASVITLFAGVFLTIITALMVLPIVKFGCPYKSPIGWACVWMWNRVIQMTPQGKGGGRWKAYRQAHLAATSWVRRDLYRVTGVPRFETDVSVDKKAQFAAEVLVPMVHALSWVRKDSEHTVVHDSIDACVVHIHETVEKLISPGSAPPPDPGEAVLHRLKSSFFATCKLLTLDPTETRDALRNTYAFTKPSHVGLSGYDAWKAAVYRTQWDSSGRLLTLIGRVTDHPRHSASDEEVKIAYRILVSAMKFTASYMLPDRIPVPETPLSEVANRPLGPLPTANMAFGTSSSLLSPPATVASTPTINVAFPVPHPASSPNIFPAPSDPPHLPPPSSVRPIPVFSGASFETFMDIFCLLEAIISVRPPERDRGKVDAFIECTTNICRLLSEDAALDRQYVGLRTVMFQTLCRVGHPEQVLVGLLTDNMIAGRVLDHVAHLNGADRYVIAAVRIWGNGQEYLERPETRNLFAIAADLAFQHCSAHINMNELIGLFRCASEAARFCRERKWTNSGCYHELPWLSTLVKVLKDKDIPYFPLSSLTPLLDELQENKVSGLLSGANMEADLATLRGLCETREGSKLRASLKTLHRESAMADDSTGTQIDIEEVFKRIHQNPIPQLEDDRTSLAHSRSSTLYDVHDARLSQYSGTMIIPKDLQECAATIDPAVDQVSTETGNRHESSDRGIDVHMENSTSTADAPSQPTIASNTDDDARQPGDRQAGEDTRIVESTRTAQRTHSAYVPSSQQVVTTPIRPRTIASSPPYLPQPVAADREPGSDLTLFADTDHLSPSAGPSTPRPQARFSGRSLGDFTMQMPFPSSGGLSPPHDPGSNAAYSRGSIGRSRQRLSMISPVSIPEEPEGPILVVPAEDETDAPTPNIQRVQTAELLDVHTSRAQEDLAEGHGDDPRGGSSV